MTASHPHNDPKNTSKKFLFDIHVFDENGKDLNAVPDVPPPPTFSEAELSQANADGYAQGKKDGLAEAAASREQFIARQLETIAAHFQSLFGAEHIREKEYEHEAVRLALATLSRVFPALNERIGTEELNRAIVDILIQSSGKSVIDIEVSEDCAAEVEALLQRKWPKGEKGPAYTIKGRPDLKSGACRMTWADGGAVRNPAGIAQKMKERLLALLPADDIAAQNDTDVSETPEHAIVPSRPEQNGDPA